jgi:hypothetical protein
MAFLCPHRLPPRFVKERNLGGLRQKEGVP